MCPGYQSSAGPQLGSARVSVSSGSRCGGGQPASANRTRKRPAECGTSASRIAARYGLAREMNVCTRTDVRLGPSSQSYVVRAMPVRMSMTCAVRSKRAVRRRSRREPCSPSKTSMAFHAGAAAMRGTSPAPCSKAPATIEGVAPMPERRDHDAEVPVADEGRGRARRIGGGQKKVESRVARSDAAARRAATVRDIEAHVPTAIFTATPAPIDARRRDGGPASTRHSFTSKHRRVRAAAPAAPASRSRTATTV